MKDPASNSNKSFLTVILWPEQSDSLFFSNVHQVFDFPTQMFQKENNCFASKCWYNYMQIDTHLDDTKGVSQ